MMGKDEGFFLLMLDCFFVAKKLLRKVAATGSSSCFFFFLLNLKGLGFFRRNFPLGLESFHLRLGQVNLFHISLLVKERPRSLQQAVFSWGWNLDGGEAVCKGGSDPLDNLEG